MKGSGKTLEASFAKSSGTKLLENILLAQTGVGGVWFPIK